MFPAKWFGASTKLSETVFIYWLAQPHTCAAVLPFVLFNCSPQVASCGALPCDWRFNNCPLPGPLISLKARACNVTVYQ